MAPRASGQDATDVLQEYHNQEETDLVEGSESVRLALGAALEDSQSSGAMDFVQQRGEPKRHRERKENIEDIQHGEGGAMNQRVSLQSAGQIAFAHCGWGGSY